MANESKKFALLCCCLMTMQALRLVISTAGFCVVRFHIDPELFNIFISRLVNAVLMSQLFGNWLGDLIVFGANGHEKLISASLAFWAEFMCFCTALMCLCEGEAGRLTGFYWSMVIAYFWWKVGEAPATSIAALEADWYFAGFTLSGVWAACLKGIVMWCISETGTNAASFQSQPLGEVNVTVVGTRSVKTTVDYRAAKWLFSVTIVLTALMCLAWTLIAEGVEETNSTKVKTAVTAGEEKLKEAVEEALAKVTGKWKGWLKTEDVKANAREGKGKVLITVTGFKKEKNTVATTTDNQATGKGTSVTINHLVAVLRLKTDEKNEHGQEKTVRDVIADRAKEALQKVDGAENIGSVQVVVAAATTGTKGMQVVASSGQKVLVGEDVWKTYGDLVRKVTLDAETNQITGAEELEKAREKVKEAWRKEGGLVIVIDVPTLGVIDNVSMKWAVAGAVGASFGGVLAVPGAMLGAGVGWWTSAYAVALGFMVGETAKRHSVVLLAGLTGIAVLIAVTVQSVGGMSKAGAGRGKGVATVALIACWLAILMGMWRVSRKKLTETRAGSAGSRFIKSLTIIFGILGGVGGLAAGGYGVVDIDGAPWTASSWKVRTATKTGEHDEWVNQFKWAGHPKTSTTTWAALIGLGMGTLFGILVGLIIGAGKVKARNWWRVGMAGGALIGGFGGLITGEIYNGAETWQPTNFLGLTNEFEIAGCGMLIVVLGLGTVYSIYPGMAPCSITQFEYFNIIDIWILILSSIGPIVIMYADLTVQDWRLGWTILANKPEKKTWIFFGLVLLVATNLCEIVVICIMHNPDSMLAEKVTKSPVIACLLTIMMVSFQLTSTGIGFGCVAAGSFFNDGVLNVNSTLVLWTTECCGVFGEGYLTELKKYEPGKWPTQGMGKWEGFCWWNNKSFANAWAIWCCIGTTDLRRDIMLCRQ